MELYQIRTFVVVADENHLTRAAKRLNTSQPAVSAHIKALEEELGIILFDRTSKGMTLTKEGEEILESAHKVLAASDGLMNQAKNLKNKLLGVVNIGLNTDPEFLRTGILFTLLNKGNPGLSLNFTQSISGQILVDIKSGALDGGYFFGNNTHDELETFVLNPLKLVVIGPYEWKDKFENASRKELAKFPWIGNPHFCPLNDVFADMFNDNNNKPSVALIAEQESTIKSLVSAGAGMSYMLEQDAQIAAEKNELAIWKNEKIEWQLSFAYLKKRKNDPIINVLVSGIKKIWSI